MRIIKLFILVICGLVCPAAIAAINLDMLTRGGWNAYDGAGCYFFEADGNCVVCGFTTVPMKWSIDADGVLVLSDEDGFNEYVSEIKGNTMYWRDGRKAYHRPFAEKSDEIARRERHQSHDCTWRAPHSTNSLADQLYLNSWVNDSLDMNIYFYSPDTCVVTTLERQDVNAKYLWRPLDSVRVELTGVMPPHKVKTLRFIMSPDAFTLMDGGSPQHFVLNAFTPIAALSKTNDICVTPLGCCGFFSLPVDAVKFYLSESFPGSGDTPDYTVYIGGYRWACNAVRFAPAGPRISYINFAGDNDAVERSFKTMSAILGNLFSEIPSTLGEHTKMYRSPVYGDDDPDADGLLISLIKTLGSDSAESWQRNGCVTIDVRKK